MNQLEEIGKKIKKEYDYFLYYLLTGIEHPDKEREENPKKRVELYGFWESLYMVLFKNKRIRKK